MAVTARSRSTAGNARTLGAQPKRLLGATLRALFHADKSPLPQTLSKVAYMYGSYAYNMRTTTTRYGARGLRFASYSANGGADGSVRSERAPQGAHSGSHGASASADSLTG